MKNDNYTFVDDKNNILKLRELIKDLPPFCKDFFRGIEPLTRPKTRIAYAYDFKVFFTVMTEVGVFKTDDIKNITIKMLDEVETSDIEDYMEILKYRTDESGEFEITNKESGIKRKISALKSLYNYLYNKDLLKNNTLSKVKLPKIHEKEIIRLDINEIAMLLDSVESGENLSKSQKLYHEKNKIRDLAILTLLLGTGIRVSECIGININDIDFSNSAIKISRKGGKEQTIYFGDEVEKALLDYLEQRNMIIAESGHENALFLSLQNKRISVRSVEKMVKKYASTVTPLKKITPHKLRSTYGTNLYRETEDIYLVASILGHNDVNTTRKHYAAIEEDRRRKVRNSIKLRE